MKFKYLVITVLALVVSSQSAHAQFELGIRCGFGAHWIRNTAMKGFEDVLPHNGYYGGIQADYKFDNGFIIQTEVDFASKGHTDRSQYDGRYSRDLRYLDIPLYFGYQFGRHLILMAGPQFGCLLGATINDDGDRRDGKGDCYPCNAAIVAQCAFMFTEKIGLTAGFDYSFTRTFSVPYVYGPNMEFEKPDEGRNIGFQIGFCYKFLTD